MQSDAEGYVYNNRARRVIESCLEHVQVLIACSMRSWKTDAYAFAQMAIKPAANVLVQKHIRCTEDTNFTFLEAHEAPQFDGLCPAGEVATCQNTIQWQQSGFHSQIRVPLLHYI